MIQRADQETGYSGRGRAGQPDFRTARRENRERRRRALALCRLLAFGGMKSGFAAFAVGTAGLLIYPSSPASLGRTETWIFNTRRWSI